MRILIVEDDPLTRLDLESRLSELGHSVSTSSDPNEAIEMGMEYEPQVVISDWKLGNSVDGLGVCNQLLSMNPQLYVVMVTGASPTELLQNAYDVRVKNLLTKPLCQKDLEGVLTRAEAWISKD